MEVGHEVVVVVADTHVDIGDVTEATLKYPREILLVLLAQ